MDCPVLKRLLKEDGTRCLLLDCRSFLAYSAGHIRGAVNARCNTIVRRRAKGSVLSLDQILAGDDEVRARLRSGMYSAVVLYDERTPDADVVKEDSTASLVLHALCGDSTATRIYFLKGENTIALFSLSPILSNRVSNQTLEFSIAIVIHVRRDHYYPTIANDRLKYEHLNGTILIETQHEKDAFRGCHAICKHVVKRIRSVTRN